MAQKHTTHRQIQTPHVADGVVTTAKLGNLAVTSAKMERVAW